MQLFNLKYYIYFQDMTPCMSPLPYDGPLIERPGLVQIEEENEATFKSRLGMEYFF